jgi:LEA14-like dessication related protein
MQNFSRGWLSILTAMLALAALAGCAGMGRGAFVPPQVTLADLNPRAFGLFEQRVSMTLRVTNPNDRALDIDGFRYTVTLNGQPFANGVSRVRAKVPRLGEAFVVTEASISTVNLLRQVIEAQTLNGFAYGIQGEAFVRTAGGIQAVPFTQEGALGRLPGPNANPQAPRYGTP